MDDAKKSNNMRVDKFLWCIRVYKTRSIAADHCRSEKVHVNNELIKASRELKINDVITVRKGPISFRFQVLGIPVSRVGAKLVMNYAKDVTTEEEMQKLERIRLQQNFERPRGLGRPTKRERRVLDDFMEGEFDDLDTWETT
jgi:ribosome-associated heat shock protein Hsp15